MHTGRLNGLSMKLLLFLCINIYCGIEAAQEIHPLLQSYVSTVLQGVGPNVLDTAPTWSTPLTSPLKGVLRLSKQDIEKAEYYCLFAYAAYCPALILENYNCTYCNATGSDVKTVQVIQNNTFQTQAFIAISDMRKEIVVSFRGSSNVPNAIEDVLFVPVEIGNSDIHVHKGFLGATRSMYPTVAKTVKNLIANHSDYSITVVGHSLGGAEAILTVYFFTVMNEFPFSNKLSLFTYGQPRVGNKAFVDYINSLNISAARVVNRADIFAHLPPAIPGYLHTQNQLFLNNGVIKYCNSTIYEDPKCSNSYGPFYSIVDHLSYFDLQVNACFENNTTRFLFELVRSLQNFIPDQTFNVLKPTLDNLVLQIENMLG